MKLDGQLERAQLELISATTSTPSVIGRVYADITDTTNALPRFYDGTSWTQLLKRVKTVVSVTTTATLGADTEYLRCDATSAAFAVTLPAVAGMVGRIVRIHKTDASFNAVTITGNASEQIDGSNTSLLASKGEWVDLYALASSWTVIAWDCFKGKVSWTPTGAWSTNTTYTGYWWRTGDRMNIEVHIALAGAPTSATLTVTMPTGTTIATASLLSTAAGQPIVGYVNVFDTSATDNFIATPYYSSSTALTFKKDDGDGTVSVLTQAAPMTFASGDAIDIVAMNIPMTNWRG